MQQSRFSIAIVFAVSLAHCLACDAAKFTWTGATDSDWHTSENWQADTSVPGKTDAVVISRSKKPSTIVLKQNAALRSLTFDPGALNASSIQGKALVLGDGASVTFAKLPGDVGMGKTASQTIASDLILSGNIQFANMNRHYLGGEKIVIRGAMSGNGSIVIDGVKHGIVQLYGDNSDYIGSFVINTGSLMISHGKALGSGNMPVTMDGGAFVLGARISTNYDFVVKADADWDAHGPSGNHDGTITVNRGATLTVKNGGGNTMTYRGAMAGEGDVTFTAHGTTFAGDRANTLTGTVKVGGSRGATVLSRAKNANVVVGPLVMIAKGTLRWNADEQLADGVPITFAGELPTLELRGHSESAGTLDLQSDAQIDLGAKPSTGVLAFADSSATSWAPGKVLLILNGGKGRCQIRFGKNSDGLISAQLNRIGFINPIGFAPGTYTAILSANGTLLPSGTKVKPINLPLDLSTAAAARRSALYEVPGLVELAGKDTALRKDTVISVFGDSITWGGGYIRKIKDAIDKSEHTSKLGVKVINHGVNGGGVLAIRDGDNSKAHVGNTKPQPFAETIATDKADVAVIYIGVNDAWWRKTKPGTFEKALRDIVSQAKANNTIPVLATLALLKESVGKENPNCDVFAELTRKVANDTGATLVDLRAAFKACLANESVMIRPGGSWTSDWRILTHDGVHMNQRGDSILANLIANGIQDALKK